MAGLPRTRPPRRAAQLNDLHCPELSVQSTGGQSPEPSDYSGMHPYSNPSIATFLCSSPPPPLFTQASCMSKGMNAVWRCIS